MAIFIDTYSWRTLWKTSLFFWNFSKMCSFLKTIPQDISKVTEILELKSILGVNKRFRGPPANFLWITFFVPTYFWNFRLPTSFRDSHLLTSFWGYSQVFIKKNEKKNYIRVQYVRIWIILIKFSRDFSLLKSFQNFCLSTSFTETFSHHF